MKKDQRYRRIDQSLGDDDFDNDESRSVGELPQQPYRDDPQQQSDNVILSAGGANKKSLKRSQSTPLSTPENSSHHDDDPMLLQPRSGDQKLMNNSNKSNSSYNNNLHMRRALSPSSGGRNNSNHKLSMSREGSEENIVILEGLGHVEGHSNGTGAPGSITSPQRQTRLNYNGNSGEKKMKKKKSDTEDGGSSVEDDVDLDDHESAHGAGSREDDGDALFCASHGSSFDLLDDEDELNLQRYHRDYFDSSPYSSNYQDDGWDDDDNMMLHTPNMYHPRTESNGSHSKDPWIRMVQQQQQFGGAHSPTNGMMPFSAIHSISDLLLYLQAVRRQARQRRAQRLLTMPSEQWYERLQFCFMTYCWDATDVGLLVVAILLVVWFFGLLWLAKIKARETARQQSQEGATNNSGAEYNGNAEFDTDYESAGQGGSLLQWWWWGLGFVLLVRILGPFAVQNVNNHRRERRRQRFMSGAMQDQQRRMHHQQLPTIIGSPNGDGGGGMMSPEPTGSISSPQPQQHQQHDSLSGVEITETGGSNDAPRPRISMM